jgi:hypothetical protein
MIWNHNHFSRQNANFTFKKTNSHIFNNGQNTTCDTLTWLYENWITSCKKNHSKIHSYEKVILALKDMQD